MEELEDGHGNVPKTGGLPRMEEFGNSCGDMPETGNLLVTENLSREPTRL